MDWVSGAREILAAGLVLLVPGSALLAWSEWKGGRRGDALCWLADAAALSIALPALLALWLFVGNARLSGFVVAWLYAVCLLLLITAAWKRGIFRALRAGGLRSLLLAVALGLGFAALAAWRLYQARSLALPAWVDSVHHTLLVRIIYEYGGLPADLSPYLPVPLSYHYGFHLAGALFAFFAGLPPDRAVLWFGQVINALVGLSVYRLAYVVSGSPGETGAGRARLAALVAGLAVLLVTFAFQMPAYYLTWGRYTLLTGLALLGPAMAAAVDLWDAPRRRATWLRLALLVGGLCLAHYFALLLAGLFLVVMGVWGVVSGLRRDRALRQAAWGKTLVMALVSIAGAVLASPWIYRVWWYNQVMANVQVVPADLVDGTGQISFNNFKYLIALLGPRRNEIIMIMAAVGLLFAFRRARLRWVAAWAVLLVLLSLPWGLRLGPFRPDHYVIILFFPAAVLLADLLASGAEALGRVARPWAGVALLTLAGALLVAWGMLGTRDVVNSVTVIATQADVAALDWINQYTPPDARFYTNGALWMGNTYRGLDGGYWILPYTGRSSINPPAIFSWGSPDYVKTVTHWSELSSKITTCDASFWSLVQEAGLTYVYLREGIGSLQPAGLTDCPRLRLVYQKDGVFLYQILPRP